MIIIWVADPSWVVNATASIVRHTNNQGLFRPIQGQRPSRVPYIKPVILLSRSYFEVADLYRRCDPHRSQQPSKRCPIRIKRIPVVLRPKSVGRIIIELGDRITYDQIDIPVRGVVLDLRRHVGRKTRNIGRAKSPRKRSSVDQIVCPYMEYCCVGYNQG